MKDGYDLPGDAPGQYMPLQTQKALPKAYFPDRLPPRLDPSDDVLAAHGRAMWALGRLEGLGSEIDTPGAVFSSFVYKEAEQSSRVEGTAVTVADIYRYAVDGETAVDDATPDHEVDVREARNYISALDEAVDYLRTAGIDRENITTELITSLHETLLSVGRTREDDPHPGEFRPGLTAIEEQNPHGPGTRVRFIPPKPAQVEGLMADLEAFIQSGSDLPALIEIAVAHYQFETIHPFADGNGRVGRLLVVLQLLTNGLLHYPLLYLSSYIERNRSEYADRLLAVSEAGEWEPWLLFFLHGIRHQAEEAFVRAKLLLEQRHTYEQRYADGPPSVRQLAVALFEDPYVTATEATDRIDVVYETANTAVERLEADGVLTEITGRERNRVFRATEIMEIVERPASELPAPEALVDIDHAWTLPDRPRSP